MKPWYIPTDVVTDETETSRLGLSFHRTSQGSLDLRRKTGQTGYKNWSNESD